MMYFIEELTELLVYGVISIIGLPVIGELILILISIAAILLVCISTMKIFEVCTTTKFTENVRGVVKCKRTSKSGGNLIPNGKGITCMPKITNYYVDVKYGNYTDTISSRLLYNRVTKGDSIDLRLIRRISRINGEETSFKLKQRY